MAASVIVSKRVGQELTMSQLMSVDAADAVERALCASRRPIDYVAGDNDISDDEMPFNGFPVISIKPQPACPIVRYSLRRVVVNEKTFA